jgi:hypothetical protein
MNEPQFRNKLTHNIQKDYLKMKKIRAVYSLLILVIFLVVNGCATTTTNITKYDDEYYRQRIINSDNLNKFKEYLAKTKIKIYPTYFNYTGKVNVTVDDVNKTFDLKKSFFEQKADTFFMSGLSGVVTGKIEQNNYVLLYCADAIHANIKDNFESGIMAFSYTLSNMSKDEALALKNTTIAECRSLGLLSSNIIYKKNIQITSNLAAAKVIPVKVDKSITSLEDTEKYTILVNDMVGQAVTEILSDEEMLQALQDFKLTTNNISEAPKVIAPAPNTQKQSINLDSSKNKCKNLGFKEGSKDFGDCVLQLVE